MQSNDLTETRVLVDAMHKLAVRCGAFVTYSGYSERILSSLNCKSSIASIYFCQRKGKYKRVVREIRGQLMQITDRREQYYAKRKAHDDAVCARC